VSEGPVVGDGQEDIGTLLGLAVAGEHAEQGVCEAGAGSEHRLSLGGHRVVRA
jgi:hypothetical protein